MDLKTVLQNIGLSEKEAKIYLVLLEMKESLPSVISKKSGIKRPTTYLILEELLKKGLASKVKKGAYYFFQAVNPHTLVEEQYSRFNDLENALPELLDLHQMYAVRPQMSLFEGEKGLIRIMEDTLTASTDLLCWADVSLATGTLLKEYYPTYVKKKVERGIWLRGIFCHDAEALKFKERSEEELREVYLIDKKEFPFKNEINIYDDKMVIISHTDKIGVIIQNKNIADTQRAIFNFAFKYAKIAERELMNNGIDI